MIKYVRILPSFPSLSSPRSTRKPTERQQTLSLYRSDYRPQSGPSQPLQTSSLSFSLFLFFSLFLSLFFSLFHSRTRWRQWTQGRSIFPGSLKIIRNTVPPLSLPSFLLPVSSSSPFIFVSFHFHLDEIWLILHDQFYDIVFFVF